MTWREISIKRFAPLLAVVAAAALAFGCGDDEASGGEGTTITTSSLSKAQYVKQANEVCTEVDNRIAKKTESIYRNEGLGDKSFTKIIETVLIPEFEGQVDQMAELGAPKGDEAQIEAMLAAMQKSVDEVKKVRLKVYEAMYPLFEATNKLVRRYGLVACSTI